MRDERRLARRAARGELDAFTTIFQRFQQDLYRYCVGILGDPEDAQDALQNTMVKALRALPGERREIDLRPWLYRIAHNESIDLIRRRRQNAPIEGSEPPVGPTLAEHVETRRQLRQLIADIGVLPERQRGALLMREAAGLGFDEIAAALGTTAAVARQTLYEARLGLREMDAGREMGCATVTRAVSDGDRRVLRRRDISAHLRGCLECRRFSEEVDARRGALASISPLPAVAAAALLQSLLGGGGGTGAVAAGAGSGAVGTTTGSGTGLGGVAATSATKAIGTATLLKGAAAIAAVAALGVGGADVGGLLHPATQDRGPAAAGADFTERLDRSRPPDAPSPLASSASDRVVSDGPQHGRAKSKLGGSAGPPRPASLLAPTPASAGAPQIPPTAPGAAPTRTSSEETGPASPRTSQVEHPTGAGPRQEMPAGVTHGQETAAADPANGKVGSGATSSSTNEPTQPQAADSGHPEHPEHPDHPEHPVHPEHPEHPVHPEHPDKPSKPEKDTPDPVADEVPPAAEQAPPAAPPVVEEAPPEAEKVPPGQVKEPPGQAKGKKP